MEHTLPLSVHRKNKTKYNKNIEIITNKGRGTILFAADQRIEHGFNSFYGRGISPDDLSSEHYFKIASRSKVNLLATHFGLICKYAPKYNNINYIVKLNSITSITKKNYGYSQSHNNISVEYIEELNNLQNIGIVGIGYTIYLGVKDESSILREASINILKSHKLGIPVILWVYPKPSNKKEDSLENVATAAMVGESLGADFVKIKSPVKENVKTEDLVKIVVKSAGSTKVLISGGESIDYQLFINQAYKNVHIGGAFGIAVGRNIHQKPLHQAVNFCNYLYNTIIEGEEPFFDPNLTEVRSII